MVRRRLQGVRHRGQCNRQADEDHSEMFLPFLASFGTGEKEKAVVQAVQESLDLVSVYRGGVAKAMEKMG